ncbi:MAG TPA: chemotaxis protein CheB [Ohtaekwangia sp.]|nr:chemotaxis protein CheB [Ohtaekwangia sp.]
MIRKPANGKTTLKEDNLCVVGVGASAGGLEAIHDLFDHMPPNTGLAFVVVQHLSPDHKSLLAELLSKHTDMQVIEAGDKMEVKPNCIYVIPSKKLITIRNGKLLLNEKVRSRLPNNAIDVLFESLAAEKKKNAVGIVLSGTGTDGTKGIEAIKRRGGVVIVQDPLTASFDGMPNSAVASGVADMILPPEMIAQELVDYLKEPPLVRELNEQSRQHEIILKEILADLYKATHRDFSHYKRPTLFRRMAKRMSEARISSLEEYRDHISNNAGELQALGKEFLINVTKFFRDPEAFKLLRTEVIPTLLENKKKGDETVKVWVAACSSGEEAYSIAMLFLEHMASIGKPAGHLKVFATDIDGEALEAASRGVFSAASAKDIPEPLLKKYFVAEGNFYKVLPDLRKYIVFANHDVLKDPPFSQLDLISCRNMFIYIDQLQQQKILKKFHFALKVDSFLMLGPSENISVLQEAMHEVNRKWKLYQCIAKSNGMDQDIMLPALLQRSQQKTAQLKNPANNLAEIFRDTVMEDRKVAAVFIDKEFNVKHAIGNYKTFLKFPDDNFNFNLLKLVIPDLAMALGVGVRKALSKNERVYMNRVMLHEADGVRLIKLIVKPYVQNQEFRHPFLCIVLEEEYAEAVKLTEPRILHPDAGIEALERELTDTRENLQAVIEELETANEELQSSNEEMISTNEELQSTNEELQSLNEELQTVSAEHQLKIKELHELNDDLNNYFRNSGIGQILVDRNLIVRKFSPVATQIINLIETDIGRSIVDITTKVKGVDLIAEIREVMRSSVQVEKEVQDHTGRYNLLHIAPFIRRDKVHDGVVISFIDITEVKQLNSILESVFQSSVSGIAAKKVVRDDQDRIVDFEYLVVNSAAEAFFGMKATDLAGKKLRETFPKDRAQYFDTYVQVVETGVTAQFEYHDQVNNRWYDVTAIKMLDGLVTTHTDITEKRKAQHVIARNFEDLKVASEKLMESNMQLERSNFDLLQFASVASHDLKEPLRKIQAFGNILQSKVEDRLSEQEIGYLQKMISASGRMQTLIEDVLTLSKLSNSGLAKERVDLANLIQNICDDLEITIKEKNAIIEIDHLPFVEAVPGQMRQLFQNLLTNSLKFCSQQRPMISIRHNSSVLAKDLDVNIPLEEFACINVTDNGIGFENQYRDKIFGVFQRLHGRHYEGTGIGLAIAKKIVENHGGIIHANGEIDKGAEFNIFLPLAK